MRAKNATLSKLASLLAIAALSAGLTACNDDDDNRGEEPCVGDECEDDTPCVGDECEDDTPCVGDECEDETAETMQQCLAIVSTNYEEGTLSIMDTNSLDIHTDITTIHSDVTLVANGETLYAVNSYGADNLQSINITDNYKTSWQYSLGNDSNPYNMAIHGKHGFIPLYAAGYVAIVDLTATNEDDFLLDDVLAVPRIADWDSQNSKLAFALEHEDVIYILAQGLNDSWACAEGAHGRVSAFDAVSFAPKAIFDGEAYIDLATCNGEHLVIIGETLYVQTLGGYRSRGKNEDDGGIEAIDLNTGKSLGMVVTEGFVGDRDIFQIVAANNGQGLWLSLVGGDNASKLNLHYLDLSGEDAELGESIYEGNIWGIAETDEYLFISERGITPEHSAGIVVFEKSSNKVITEEPLDTGLQPRGVTPFERMGSCY